MKQRPSLTELLQDTRTRSLIIQAVMLGVFFMSMWWLVDNTIANLAQQNKSFGFGFLSQTAGFQISNTLGTWMMDYQAGVSTYLDVYLIGIINTFLIAVIGILTATVIGFVIGIMRLSNNLIICGFATVYVEVTRNIPLLLQLFFWYFAVLRSLPGKSGRVELIPDLVGINITGLYLPLGLPGEGFRWTAMTFVIALLASIVMVIWSRRRQRLTGKQFPALKLGLCLVFVLPSLVFLFSGSPIVWQLPEFVTTGPVLKQGYQIDQGIQLVPEMIALWLSLSLYTAGFIAENVRGGILAVHHHQKEAGLAIGLKSNLILQLIVIPQALRIIIPPLTSQYLNLTKNSSLAVAIAYPDLVSIFAGTALSQVGKEIEMIFMMMSVYLSFSIVTALFMNWFNARVKLEER